MAGKGSGLASRLRAAMGREGDARTSAESERLKRMEAGRMARKELFDSLVEFGSQLPFLQTLRQRDGVSFEKGERYLRFLPEDDTANVVLEFSERDPKQAHRIYREPALDDRWIWVRSKGTRENRIPLFDQGLEVLLVHALDLPDPSAEPEPLAVAADPSDREGGSKRTL